MAVRGISTDGEPPAWAVESCCLDGRFGPAKQQGERVAHRLSKWPTNMESDGNISLFIFFPAALDTTNSQVKRQVFELLSALCVYSSDGYSRALEALEHYKTFKSQRYRFKVVIDELVSAGGGSGPGPAKPGPKARASAAAVTADANGYKTVLFAFINCLIISTPQLKDRNRVRNEFIGLKLLDVIKQERTRTGKKDSDLQVKKEIS